MTVYRLGAGGYHNRGSIGYVSPTAGRIASAGQLFGLANTVHLASRKIRITLDAKWVDKWSPLFEDFHRSRGAFYGAGFGMFCMYVTFLFILETHRIAHAFIRFSGGQTLMK